MGVMSDVKVSSPILGVFWMIVTGALFVAVTAVVKYLGTAIPAVEAAFLRYAGIVLLVPMLSQIKDTFHTAALETVCRRISLCWSSPLVLCNGKNSIADVTAMNYLHPFT